MAQSYQFKLIHDIAFNRYNDTFLTDNGQTAEFTAKLSTNFETLNSLFKN